MRSDEIIERAIAAVNWVELHPSPQNFINLRQMLNVQLREAVAETVADETAKALTQALPVDLPTPEEEIEEPVTDGSNFR
jgi:hypothetical protein